MSEIPERYRLSFLIGEVVRADVGIEYEVRMLDARLRDARLITARRPASFGRLLHTVRAAMDDDAQVPVALKDLASPLLRTVKEAHDERNLLAHDHWVQIPWQPQRAHSGSRQDSRELTDLASLVSKLKDMLFRVRGLWIITPAWLGMKVEPELTAHDLHNWTRIVQGNIRPGTGAVAASEGPAVLPPEWAIGSEWPNPLGPTNRSAPGLIHVVGHVARKE